MTLTPAQDRAVRSWNQGDNCVVERLRWLIVDREVPPESVLAVTFTEKAAFEMRTRLVAEGRPSRELAERFLAARVCTIDAFCHRLLKENALQAGVDPGFEVLDGAEARDMLRRAVERTLDDAFGAAERGVRSFLASYAPSAPRSPRADPLSLIDDLEQLVRAVRSHGCQPFLKETEAPRSELAAALRELAAAKGLDELVGTASELDGADERDPAALAAALEEAARATKGIRKAGKAKALVARVKDELLPECRASTASAANGPARDWLLRTTRSILSKFEREKAAAGRMDFDDILAGAADLLDDEDGPRLAFQHVLIDEFQDTNPLQIRLVDRLLAAHGRERPVRFVVGDINQSIYGFRHSDQNVFREYRRRIAEGRWSASTRTSARDRKSSMPSTASCPAGGGAAWSGTACVAATAFRRTASPASRSRSSPTAGSVRRSGRGCGWRRGCTISSGACAPSPAREAPCTRGGWSGGMSRS